MTYFTFIDDASYSARRVFLKASGAKQAAVLSIQAGVRPRGEKVDILGYTPFTLAYIAAMAAFRRPDEVLFLGF